MMHPVYLALGSNIGDRARNLQQALEKMPPSVEVIEQSPIYETPPWGVLDQPWFLNQVFRGATELSPRALLDYIKEIEVDMGRSEGKRYGPRIIDIDIIFYNHLVYDGPGLQIPHSRLEGRAFVLLPMSKIAPDFIHPVLKRSILEMLQDSDFSEIKPYDSTQDSEPPS